MGCATSALPLINKSYGDGATGVQAENEHELALLSAPPPRISINVGGGIKKFHEGYHNVVFVFGGPFSMKGLLVEELVSAFNFQVVTTEDIVLSYLPNKVANTIQTTQEIKELLQTDPSMLSLDWVLNLIGARLATNSQKLCVVDIVPNMHTILRVESFNKPDIRKEMVDFERRFPVCFALNLVVTEDKMANAYAAPGLAMKINKQTASDDDGEGQSKSSDKDKDKEGKSKSLFSEGSDEMDSSRMKRRHDLYQSCADPFLAYFKETDRLVTVQVVPMQKEFVWRRVHELFRETGFHSKKAGRTVILFAFNEEQVEGLDTIYYKMLKVSLSAIITNKNDTMDNMIKAVALYVKRSASSSQNHLVILDCLNTKMSVQISKRLNFLEIREYYLDHFIRVKSSAVKSKPFKRLFKAISTTANEVCLFPAGNAEQPPRTVTTGRGGASNAPNVNQVQPSSGGVDTNLCKKIAFCFMTADQPQSVENGSGRPSRKSSSGRPQVNFVETSNTADSNWTGTDDRTVSVITTLT